jgi:outer membrane protein assembly factor BamA
MTIPESTTPTIPFSTTSAASYGLYAYDNDGNLVDPSQFINGSDRYKKQSHELRFSSPAENRWRLTAGVFTQRQSHGIRQQYQIANWFDDFEVPATRTPSGSRTSSVTTTTTRCSANSPSTSPTSCP